MLAVEVLQRLFGHAGGVALILFRKQIVEYSADGVVVVNDEDGGHGCSFFYCSARTWVILNFMQSGGRLPNFVVVGAKACCSRRGISPTVREGSRNVTQ